MGPLREALLEHAPPSAPASLREHAGLDEQLQGLWSSAMARWPGVELSAAGFGKALGQRLGEPVSLSDLRAPDVYLAG